MNDKFYLFLNGAKNRFESSLFDPPLSLADAQAIKDEILRLLRVIDELNLSLDIYKCFTSAVNFANDELKI